eukprot:2962191-Rhodomonas_salina.4
MLLPGGRGGAYNGGGGRGTDNALYARCVKSGTDNVVCGEGAVGGGGGGSTGFEGGGGSSLPMVLRRCYMKSGTDWAIMLPGEGRRRYEYAAARVLDPPLSCYAGSGTDVGYAAARMWVWAMGKIEVSHKSHTYTHTHAHYDDTCPLGEVRY